MAERIPVLIVGAPGDLATKVLEGAKKSSDLAPITMKILGREGIVTLTGESIKGQPIDDAYVANYFAQTGVHLVRPMSHEVTIKAAKNMYQDLVGFNCANAEGFPVNFRLIENDVPTIFAGSGVKTEDHLKLAQFVDSTRGAYLPIANMALPLVDLMDRTNTYAQANSKALEGCTVQIQEMHQQTKEDASGTAKAFAEYFIAMGAPLDLTKVKAFRHDRKPRDTELDMGDGSKFMVIRNPDTMVLNGVRPEDTKGLGWHKYKLAINPPKADEEDHTKEREKMLLNFYRALKTEFFKASPLLDLFNTRSVANSYCTAASLDGNLLLHMTLNGGGKELELMHNITGRQPYVDGGMRLPGFMRTMVNEHKFQVFFGRDVLAYLRRK